MSSSFLYEKALSLDWNGQMFVLTVRKETPVSNQYGYLYSYDGNDWYSIYDILNSTILTQNNIFNVKWLGTNYAMIGNLKSIQGNNTILKSTNGINYSITNTDSNVPNNLYDIEVNLEYPHTITFPKNTTLALGGISTDTTKIAYSLDGGTTWISSTNSSTVFSTNVYNAAWNGKIWVAVGSGTGNTIATSTDGNIWKGQGSYIFNTTGYAIEWAKEQNLWIAGGSGISNTLAYSIDGVYWTGLGNNKLSTVYDVKWNGNIWVAIGIPVSGSTNSIAYSYDGKNWNNPVQTNLFNISATNITWNGVFWVVIGQSTIVNNNYNLATSYDGVIWNMYVFGYDKMVLNSVFTNPKITNTTIVTTQDGYITSIPNNNFGYSSVNSNGQISITTTGNCTVSTYGSYTLYTFTGNGTFQPSYNVDVSAIIVGGGGPGGKNWNDGYFSGGGGGGGGVGVGKLTLAGNVTYNINVGAGGVPYNNGSKSASTNGGNSSIIGGNINEIAFGGGYGAYAYITFNPSYTTVYVKGENGGSGGGGLVDRSVFAPGTSKLNGGTLLTYYGNSGGSGNYSRGGGGGGAGSAGISGDSTGNGGNGYNWNVNNTTYGGGGGGGGSTLALGGSGGGGNSCYTAGPGIIASSTPGAPNTGGGGGGHIYSYGPEPSSGGSGVVIIAILTSSLFVPIYTNFTKITSITPINTSIYNGSQYLLGGNSYISSSDATNWSSTKTITGMTTINKFAWNSPDIGTPSIKPITIAVGEGNNTIGWSPDGIYWNGLGKSIFSLRGNRAIWNGVLWVAVGTGNFWVASSYDGQNWIGRNNQLMTEGYDVAWNGTVFVAVGYGGMYNMAASRDGIEWYGLPYSYGVFSLRASAITWTGNVWLAYGSGGNTTAYSNDIDAWFWNSTTKKNCVITNATSALISPGISNITASTSSSNLFLPINAIDNSMNLTGSTNWMSGINTYNTTTGVNTGLKNTSYYILPNSSIFQSASGEWIQLAFPQSIFVKYYQLSWFITGTNNRTIPREWYFLGTNDGNLINWCLLDYYNVTNVTSLPHNNTYKYPIFTKLQNITNNNEAYAYYRIVIPSIFSSASASNTFISEIDLFQYSATSDIISPYLKPIITKTHILYQSNIVRYSSSIGSQTVFQIADLSGNLINNCYINNGYWTNNIIYGAGSNAITSTSFDGSTMIATTLNGNVLSLTNDTLNSSLNFDISFNGTNFVTNIGENIYSSCSNGQRILLGGNGGNVITYNTLTANGSSIWTNTLNANTLFTKVNGLASNPGYGRLYIPNRIYLNPGEEISLISPTNYNSRLSSKNNISINLNNTDASIVQKITLPTSTIINGILGPTGITGPVGVGYGGCYGPTGFFGIMGPTGSTIIGSFGCTGNNSLTGETGTIGTIGQTGITGYTGGTGTIGTIGQTGITGYTGQTGIYGPTGAFQTNEWLSNNNNNNSIYFNNTINVGREYGIINNLFSALNVFENFNTHNLNITNISSNIVFAKESISSSSLIDNENAIKLHGNAYFNKQIIVNNKTFANKLKINQLNQPVLKTSNVDAFLLNTINLNYINANEVYWIDALNLNNINDNFTCVLNNFPTTNENKVYKLKLIINYNNLSNRFFCIQLKIHDFLYNVHFTAGNPVLNSINTLLIEEFSIFYINNSIWKIVCKTQKYN